MEIECQGCYFTLCSFVCLTEDLSEILQFLWRHGCLRRSYFCEKCGRKCAIGDKDLFFRCNRNTLDTPLSAIHSNTQQTISCQQTHSQIQVNKNGQINIQQQSEQYAICNSNSSNASQSSTLTLSSENLNNYLINHENKPQHTSVIHSVESVPNDSVSAAIVPNPTYNHTELSQNNRVLTIVEPQRNHIAPTTGVGDNLVLSDSPNVHLLSNLQSQSVIIKPQSQLKTNQTESNGEEPSAKLCKKSIKSDVGKVAKKRCNFKVSMKKGTFFEKSKLPIDTVCKFVVFWCCMKHPTQEFLRNELSLATRTVVDWSTACREICIHWAKSVSEKIGGDGVMVQVDEVKILDNKESKQSINGNKYSYWGMEKDKEKGRIFIVPVPACDSWSLLTVINDWILPGSVIISNCWKAYNCLNLQEFIQQTIVQSKTFVHPQNSTGHQSFDGKSDETSASGELNMPKFGTRRSHHLGDLAEFMFKRRYSNHLERMHVFFKQISLAYPLH